MKSRKLITTPFNYSKWVRRGLLPLRGVSSRALEQKPAAPVEHFEDRKAFGRVLFTQAWLLGDSVCWNFDQAQNLAQAYAVLDTISTPYEYRRCLFPDLSLMVFRLAVREVNVVDVLDQRAVCAYLGRVNWNADDFALMKDGAIAAVETRFPWLDLSATIDCALSTS